VHASGVDKEEMQEKGKDDMRMILTQHEFHRLSVWRVPCDVIAKEFS
jgi:hypothetical protein